MNSKLQKIKKLIKNFKYIVRIENEIDIYFKYGNETAIKKLKNKQLDLNKIKEHIEEVRRVIAEETEKLDFIGEKVCKQFCFNGKSITAISMDCYISVTTAYREINKFAVYIYIIYLENKKFKKSVNYLINQLQNVL